MLVLSRKLNERIQIGENITITVVKVQGGVVRLGIEAPREIPVRRQELKARGDILPSSDGESMPHANLGNEHRISDSAQADPHRRPESLDPVAVPGGFPPENGQPVAPAKLPRPGAGLRAMVAAIRRLSADVAAPQPADARIAG